MLSDKEIQQFRAIYREKFGSDISTELATIEANKLFVFAKYACRPMSLKRLDQLDKARKQLRPLVVKRLKEDPHWLKK